MEKVHSESAGVAQPWGMSILGPEWRLSGKTRVTCISEDTRGRYLCVKTDHVCIVEDACSKKFGKLLTYIMQCNVKWSHAVLSA